jgi:hypothetical protein
MDDLRGCASGSERATRRVAQKRARSTALGERPGTRLSAALKRRRSEELPTCKFASKYFSEHEDDSNDEVDSASAAADAMTDQLDFEPMQTGRRPASAPAPWQDVIQAPCPRKSSPPHNKGPTQEVWELPPVEQLMTMQTMEHDGHATNQGSMAAALATRSRDASVHAAAISPSWTPSQLLMRTSAALRALFVVETAPKNCVVRRP